VYNITIVSVKGVLIMTEFTEKQRKCLDYFEKNLPEWLKDDLKKNKYVVIHDESIKGIYDTAKAAADFAFKKFTLGDFIIQEVFDENEAFSFLSMAV